MNVAKYLLLAVWMLPVAELAAFIAVAAAIGFLWALTLVVAGSFAGALILRHAGGNHIARMRVVMNEGSFTSLQADSAGLTTLLAGFLLLIPGFITDAAALLVLIAPLRRALASAIGGGRPPPTPDGIVDLEPEQWHRVPDKALADRNPNERRGGAENSGHR